MCLQVDMVEEPGRADSLFESIWRPFPGECLMADERRRHPRTPTSIPVVYHAEGKTHKDYILNISSGGVFIGTTSEVSWSSEIVMTFKHPVAGVNLSIVGRVAWASLRGVGVRFKRLVQRRQKDAVIQNTGNRSEKGAKEVYAMGKIRRKRIRWEPSMSDDVAKYRLYWSEDGMIDYSSKYVDVGKVTEVVIPDDLPAFPLIKGTVSFGIAAVNESGNESEMTTMSAEIDFVVPDPPTNLMVEDL